MHQHPPTMANSPANPLSVLFVIPAAALALFLAVCFQAEPVLFAAGVAFVVLTLAVLRNFDLITLFVLFVIYSNAAVVAVKFHGVPEIAGQAVIVLAGVPLAGHLFLRGERIVLGPAFPWVMGFGVIQFLGALAAKRPELAWEGFVTFLAEGVLLYLLFSNLVRTPKMLKASIWSLLLAGCLMGGVPLFQELTGTYENNYGGFAQAGEPGFGTGELTLAGEVMQQRLSGPIGEKNRYAQIMLMLLPLGILMWKHESARRWKWLAAAAISLAAAGGLLAFSRGAIVALGITLVCGIPLGLVSGRKVFALGALGFVLLLLTPQYQARMLSLLKVGELFSGGRQSSADGALKGRATEMGAAALVYLDHPAIGVGPGQFKYYSQDYGKRIGLRSLAKHRQAHCLPLDVAAETGSLGLFCLAGAVTMTLRSLLRIYRDGSQAMFYRQAALAFLVALGIYLTNGLFLHFAFIRYFWLMMALADAVTAIAQKETINRSLNPAPC